MMHSYRTYISTSGPAVFFSFFFLMIRRPPRSTHCISSAASDVYKRQVQTLDPVEKKHSTVEKQFDLQGPVDAIDMGYAEQALNHDQIAKRSPEINQFARQSHQVGDGKGQNDCYPIRREQTTEARDNKIHRPRRFFQCHEYNEAADNEEQVNAVVAVGK
eukprot:TRINITY_DN5470_c0_g1_i1.p2 TRINITY_DN5470_c0_g1~~TRINITY_DN5470_c0_g1_i1.p2  ORF type:complete len:160 (-),score=18.29 TRINITY_DN5470_c0_g1_i1:428-907(-)